METFLNATQQALLFTRLSQPGSGANVDQVLCHVPSALDTAALEQAVRHVVAQHAALRARFVWQGRAQPAREPVAGCLPSLRIAEAHTDAELEALLTADRREDFPLDAPPHLRVTCIRRGDARSAVLVTTPHIAVDRSSLAVVLHDLFAAYEGYARGDRVTRELSVSPRPPSMRPPSALDEAAVAHFRALLGDVSARTPLEFGFVARDGADVSRSAPVLRTRLSAADSDALRTCAERLGSQPESLLEAAVGLVLARYSGEEDVLFGVTSPGRASAAVPDDRVGCYVHTLPRRLRLAGHERLDVLVQAIDAQRAGSVPYERISLHDLQRCSLVPAGMPLFDCLVSWEGAPLADALRDSVVSAVEHVFKSTFPLTLAAELGDTLRLSVGFDPQRYDAASVARLISHVERTLVALAHAPAELRLADVPVLSEAELHQLTDGWNDTAGSYPSELRIHEPFEAQVAARPEATALLCGEHTLSYAALEARANQLAHVLQSHGVGRGARVGICMPRQLETVVAMLAVLKAGAAYVPLDPAYPEDRVRFMLEDSAASVVITVESLLASLPAEAARYVVVDRDAALLASAPAERPACASEPDDVAYIIYTSGSTGRPKGVVVRHRPALNLMDWVNGAFGVGPSDRLLFVTSICFDLSVYDVFGALGAGASVHVARSEELKEPRRLLALLSSGGITVWDSAPAAFAQLVPFLPARAEGSALRLVMLSGDWIPVPLPDQIRASFPRAKVVSLGGATEATVWSNYYEVAEVPSHWPSIPYGRPIRNARYYVLDKQLRPMPVGAAGELHIGGDCLADGYLHRPELSAEKFIHDPYGKGPSAKLYKTGDLARFMPDGNLEFLGRIDLQVKVRGFRVELGEIEAVLNQHPLVASALVDAPRLSGGERTLVAYVVPSGARPDLGELRALCQAKLTEYMVPAHIMVLDALPVTANGKVDRRALPAPTASASASYVAPRSPLEQTVCEVLASMLQAPRVGALDHFFELGGHSLLAVRTIGELGRRYEVELSLAEFLAEPTAEALARTIAERAAAGAPQGPRLVTADADAPALVSLDQRRLAFVQSLYPDSPVYNLTFAFSLRGKVDVQLLEAALAEVVARHEPLRTGFRSALDGYEAVILAEARVPVPHVDLTGLKSEARAGAFVEQARVLSAEPFDLAAPPLVRALCATLGPDEHTLVLVIHHTVFDGASTPILVRELVQAYDALHAGRPVALPPLAIRFNDVARHQQDYVASADFGADVAYYREALGGTLTSLQLPRDHARPRVVTYRGAVHGFALSPAHSERLRKLAQSLRSSTFTLLLAAYQAYLMRLSGQRDIVVGIPVALRDQPEAAQLIGLILNTLPIRSDVPAGISFAALQEQVRGRVLSALGHRHLPFERIVAALNPPRDPSTTPIFQALFSHQETGGALSQSEHFSVTSQVVDQCFAATDISLFTEDAGERGVTGYFSYSTDLWTSATAERVVAGFTTFLEHLIDSPSASVDALPAMAPEARVRELYAFNQTRRAYDLTQSVVDLFEAQAVRTPERLAVLSDHGELRYGELAREVTALSESLRALGAGPGVAVAVALGRSPRMLSSLLAVLRTGAHYVPLDPSHPEERNQRILRVARPKLVLVERDTAPSVGAPAGSTLVRMDEPLPAGAPFDPHAGVDAHGVAYIIFTSGSTGDPKGVEVPRDALTNFLLTMVERPGLTADDRVLALTTISFDIAGLELYLPLLVGASVDVADRELALDPRALAARLLARHITLFQATPAYYRMLIESGWQGQKDLKVLCGGEAFPPEIVQALLPRVASVWNMYGPTETTVWSSVEQLTSAEPPISIGLPIANTEMYVLNEALEPVPSGATGMLWIGGDGVALGYHGRPDLTEVVFRPDPFSGRAGARIYCTGDLARRLPDGRLECLGRNDFQVKVRGYRIELGEIEAALLSHPAVLQAVVHLKPSPSGDKRLVGYVVRHDRATALPSDLADHLKAHLPPYMVPSAFVAMPAFPLTPNGKVDRKALPEPSETDSPTRAELVAPRSDVEVKVAEIFSRLLGKDRLSIHDSFFDAGGHSLLAVRVTAEINAAFGVDLSVGAMFEDPTVAALAVRIAAGGGKLGSAVLPLQAGSEQQPIYFICGIQLYQQLARLIGDTHASYGLFVPAEDEFMQASAALTDLSITRLASAYAEAIDKHRPAGPLALVGVSFGGLLAFEVARQLSALGREVGSLTLLDTVLPAAMQRNWPAWLAYRVRQLQKKGVSAALDSLKAKLTPKAPIVISPDESRDNHLWRLLNSELVDRYFARGPSYAGPTLIIRAELRDEYDATFDVEPGLGWSRYLTGPVRVASSPGDHLGILQRAETAALVHAHVAEHVRVELPRASVPPPRPSYPSSRAPAHEEPQAARSAAG